MGKDTSELASYFRPLAEQLIHNCCAAGITVAIIDCGRTPQEQTVKITQKVSWTRYSKHEPQPPEGLSEAIDIAPVVLLSQKLWAPASPLWKQIGSIGKTLGLRWGGDWVSHPDPSHFEYAGPKPTVTTTT